MIVAALWSNNLGNNFIQISCLEVGEIRLSACYVDVQHEVSNVLAWFIYVNSRTQIVIFKKTKDKKIS